MSLTAAGIYCTISPSLSSAMEDCSIVRVQQLRMLCRRRCMSIRVTTHFRPIREHSGKRNAIIIRIVRIDFTVLNLYCIKGALALFVLVSFSGYVC